MENIFLYWWNCFPNFGDVLSPYLTQKLTSHKICHYSAALGEEDIHYGIGSILLAATKNSIIWGSGFMGEIQFEEVVPIQPKTIHAVRGPLTRRELLLHNIKCPEIYGDPALLMPRFYNPPSKIKYDLGIIPHYVDADNQWIHNNIDANILLLNVQDPPEIFIDKLLCCKTIISSSLHGLIIADAYRIPNVWVKFSEKVGGKGFKFQDYFASIHSENRNCVKINSSTSLIDVMSKIQLYTINLDIDTLLKVCPFV